MWGWPNKSQIKNMTNILFKRGIELLQKVYIAGLLVLANIKTKHKDIAESNQ